MTSNSKDIGKLLRKYGYSIPLSEDEVKAFENKYKKDYESPQEWSSIDEIIEDSESETKKVISINDYEENKSIAPLSMAAREGKKITNEIRMRMNEDKKDAKK